MTRGRLANPPNACFHSTVLKRLLLSGLSVGIPLAFGCSSDPAPAPFAPPPASVVVDDPGPVKIRREAFVIDGVVPPPNPAKNAATPPEQNKLRVVRYRVDADPPRPARAIVVMMPGFLGGAGSLDGIARAIVRRSGADAFEAWAIDRRSNLLEDTHGLDVAEVQRDPTKARAYYEDGATIEGKSFAGFKSGVESPWASEWGAATTLGDLRAAIALVPQAERAQRVILLGHSLGGILVEEYAAWDFGGTAGHQEIAGLVLVDGVSGSEGKAAPFDQTGYEDGAAQSGVGFGPRPGVVKDVRGGGNVFVTIPFLGTRAYMVSEYVAMQARFAPEAISDDDGRDSLLSVLLGQTPMPKLTNRAAFGFAFDDESCGLQIAAVSCGKGEGGAITEYDSALGGKLKHPSDSNATYRWKEYDAVDPKEATSIDDAARAWYEGPQLNFAEWYFPQRLTIDATAASTLDVADDDWRAKTYGLLAKHGKTIDVPVLAAGSVVAKTGAYENLRTFLPPVGAGRPSAGKARTDPDAFTAIDEPTLTHIDWVVGRDVPGTPLGKFYDALGAFLTKQTPSGGVAIAKRN
jgi:pimeloyl-ACP methyl ester carboxylesterase